MHAEDVGAPCLFELTLRGLRPFACSLGCQACLPNEACLHSYNGEAKALQYGVKKNHHLCHGRPFTNIGDCVSIRWILFYSGPNPVIKQIQLELMGWWMMIVHRPQQMNIPPDYVSKMGTEFHFDPLLDQYQKDRRRKQEKQNNPPTATGSTIRDENLPNLRGIGQQPNLDATATMPCHLSITSYKSLSNTTLTITPCRLARHIPPSHPSY
jgi:hypothetical protein